VADLIAALAPVRLTDLRALRFSEILLATFDGAGVAL
jgi:hypothetical protein